MQRSERSEAKQNGAEWKAADVCEVMAGRRPPWGGRKGNPFGRVGGRRVQRSRRYLARGRAQQESDHDMTDIRGSPSLPHICFTSVSGQEQHQHRRTLAQEGDC